ncbi:MAG: translocation/assembly module TamB domain-containing protein, partial [Zoogloeaceae bacterium]|nr:translocation/assembly module TamB domain-containing protein [Zoogloeaceae bacterium]
MKTPTPPSANPPHKPRRRWRRGLRALAGVVLLMLAAGIWLTATESGLRTLVGLAKCMGDVEIAGVTGRLIGPLTLRELSFSTGQPASPVSLYGLEADWSPASLLQGRLDILHLRVERLVMVLPAGNSASPRMPETLALPLAVRLARLEIENLHVLTIDPEHQQDQNRKTLDLNHIQAGFESDGVTHRLTHLEFDAEGFHLHAAGELQGTGTMPLHARLSLQGQGATKHPVRLEARADGPLSRLELQGELKEAAPEKGETAPGKDEGESGHFSALLTPFAAQPVEYLKIRLQGIDPARWRQAAPRARLDIEAEIRPAANAASEADETRATNLPNADAPVWINRLAGHFSLFNRAPAPLDQHGLPLTHLRGILQWRDQRLDIQGLEARLSGKGRQPDSVFKGALHLETGAASEPPQSTPSQNALRHLTASGELTALNPALLSSGWPEGDLHGRLQLRLDFAADQPVSPPTLAAQFELKNSRLAGQPFEGAGQLQWHEERLTGVDVHLAAGANRLALKGDLGRPQDRLHVEIQAARLEALKLPLPLSGDLDARLQLSGALRAPRVAGQMHSQRLNLPGDIHLRGLALEADLGVGALFAPSPDKGRAGEGFAAVQPGTPPKKTLNNTVRPELVEGHSPWKQGLRQAQPERTEAIQDGLEADHSKTAPLNLILTLTHLKTPQGNLQDTRLRLQGSRRQHEIRLETSPRIPQLDIGSARLLLVASGALSDQWRGKVETLTLNTAEAAPPLLQLTAPALLRLGAAHVALEAAPLRGRIRGGDWNAQIAQLQYQNGHWNGQLNARMDDIAWLSPLLGDGYQVGGRLETALTLAGSAAQPQIQGHLTGEALHFRALNLGLRLESGRVRVRFDEHRLNLEQFAFDAPHGPLPKTLDRPQQESLRALVERPGHIEGRGHLRLQGDDLLDGGQLEFQLQRLGVAQKPDQWVVLSGQGQLRLEQQEARLDAQLAVDGAYWQLAAPDAPRLSDDVRIVRSTSAAPAPRRLRTRMNLGIDLGSHFYFAGAGVHSRLRGNLSIQGDAQEPPRATGSIRTVEGRFDAYGQKLEIEQGILTFNGLVQNPGLNIRALRKNLPVEAGVSITGTARKPVIKLVSTPNVPDAEKLSWLVLGEAPEQNDGNDASALLAAANAILGGQDSGPGSLLASLQQRLGVNVSVGRGAVGSHSGP